MALSLDGNVQSTFSGTNTATVSLTTTKVSDVIVVVVSFELGAAQRNVTSVTAAGLTFARRSQLKYAAQSNLTIETWWAGSPGILSAEAITVLLDGNIDDACVAAFAVNGAGSLTTPWDTDGGLPDSAQGAGPAAVTFSTVAPSSFVFGMITAVDNNTTISPPSGWFQIATPTNPGGSLANFMNVDGKVFSAPQSGATYTSSASIGGTQCLSAVDAIAGPSGVHTNVQVVVVA